MLQAGSGLARKVPDSLSSHTVPLSEDRSKPGDRPYVATVCEADQPGQVASERV